MELSASMFCFDYDRVKMVQLNKMGSVKLTSDNIAVSIDFTLEHILASATGCISSSYSPHSPISVC